MTEQSGRSNITPATTNENVCADLIEILKSNLESFWKESVASMYTPL